LKTTRSIFCAAVLLLVRCGSLKAPHRYQEPETRISIEPGFEPAASICLWKDDRKAAYTIGFDDSYYSSHYKISAPEIGKRGIYGTFYLNTQAVTSWEPWRAIVLAGHEIASHTRSHPRLTELDESQVRDELSQAVSDILSGVPEQKEVPSFSYPYGLHDEKVQRIAAEYHESARGGAGLNPPSIAADDYWRLRGISIYPPYDMSAVRERLMEGIRDHSWILVYFHIVSADDSEGPITIPQSLFLRHIDDVAALRDSLWFAPQRDVVRYSRMRDRAEWHCSILDNNALQMTLLPGGDGGLNQTELSLNISLPSSWLKETLVIRHASDTGIRRMTSTGPTVIQNLYPGDTLTISAVKE
jgi:peptidoglycan/xylan/chitin deacetylase (PgdA/CDA1 family)